MNAYASTDLGVDSFCGEISTEVLVEKDGVLLDYVPSTVHVLDTNTGIVVKTSDTTDRGFWRVNLLHTLVQYPTVVLEEVWAEIYVIDVCADQNAMVVSSSSAFQTYQ